MYGALGTRHLSVLLLLMVDGMAFITAPAYVTPSNKKKRDTIKIRAFREGQGDNPQSDKLSNRTCIRQFLTQRSVQTFLFLLSQCRDPHTVKWIEDFGGSRNLMSYHGTGAMTDKFSHWDTFFNEIIQQPLDVVQVQIPNSRRPSGMSKNNPNREKEEQSHKAVTVDIDIDPPSLAGRILSIRELLGREWKEDVDLVRIATEKVLLSYNQNVHENRKDEVKNNRSSDDIQASTMDSYRKSEFDSVLESDKSHQHSMPQTFERSAIYMLNNHAAFDDMESSPLRKSNFDLLFLLSTQEAVHRTLKAYMKKGEKLKTHFLWLRNFYTSRLDKYFDGNQRFGSSDDFLDDLLLTPPAIQSVSEGVYGLVDPMLITEDIINARVQVLVEWKCILDSVSDEHKDLKRQIFIKQMDKWGQRLDSPSSSSSSKTAQVQQINEFE